MDLDSPVVLGISAAGAGFIVLAFILARTRRLDKADAGALFAALSAGFAIPKGVFLCAYYFFPDPPGIATKLHGFEKEIFVAGSLVVFIALASIWSLCEKPKPAP